MCCVLTLFQYLYEVPDFGNDSKRVTLVSTQTIHKLCSVEHDVNRLSEVQFKDYGYAY